jgi:hypothetical protein
MYMPAKKSLKRTSKKKALPAVDLVAHRIQLIRGHRVLLSTHLAELYEVPSRALVQAVKRNTGRFPDDFMFQLSRHEFTALKSQFVISSWGGLRRATPYAFTEEGVAMLSSVLKSRRAVQVNIAIMRAFVRLREAMAAHKDLAAKIESLESRYSDHDEKIQAVFGAIRKLLQPEAAPPVKRRIGYRIEAGHAARS